MPHNPDLVYGGAMSRAFSLVLLLLCAGCDDSPGQWSSYVYRDAHDRSKWERTDRFRSFDTCKRSALESIAWLPQPAKASYACVRTGMPG